MEWLTININPPKLDVKIVARSDDKYGYGCNADVYEFDSKIFTEEEAAMHLQNEDKIQWLELPK
jgi:hypothetical protein